MVEEEKIALAKVVIRNKEHLLAIRPHDWTLAAFTLHYPEEIHGTDKMKEAETVIAARIDKRNLILAKSLIRHTMGKFVPGEFSANDYSKTLLEIIRTKGKSEPVRIVPKGAAERVRSLADALEKSIERVKKERVDFRQPGKRESNAG